MKTRMGMIGAVSLVMLLAASTAFAAFGAGKKTDQALVPRWWERPKIVRELGLSGDQAGRIRDIHRQEADRIVEARWDLNRERAELEGLLEQADLDEERINGQMDRVRAALAERVGAEMRMHVRIMKELSPEQRREVLALLRAGKEGPAPKEKKSGEKRKKKKSRISRSRR